MKGVVFLAGFVLGQVSLPVVVTVWEMLGSRRRPKHRRQGGWRW